MRSGDMNFSASRENALFKPFAMNGNDVTENILSYCCPKTLRHLYETSHANHQIVCTFMAKTHYHEFEMAASVAARLYNDHHGLPTNGTLDSYNGLNHFLVLNKETLRPYYKKLPHYIGDYFWLYDTENCGVCDQYSNCAPKVFRDYWPALFWMRMPSGNFMRATLCQIDLVRGSMIYDRPYISSNSDLQIEFCKGIIPKELCDNLNAYLEQNLEWDGKSLLRIAETVETASLLEVLDTKVFGENRIEINLESLEELTALLLGFYYARWMIYHEQQNKRILPLRVRDLIYQTCADLPQAENFKNKIRRLGDAVIDGRVRFDELEINLDNPRICAEEVKIFFNKIKLLFNLFAPPAEKRIRNQIAFAEMTKQRRFKQLKEHQIKSFGVLEALILDYLTPAEFVAAWSDIKLSLPGIVKDYETLNDVLTLFQPLQQYVPDNLEDAVFDEFNQCCFFKRTNPQVEIKDDYCYRP